MVQVANLNQQKSKQKNNEIASGIELPRNNNTSD